MKSLLTLLILSASSLFTHSIKAGTVWNNGVDADLVLGQPDFVSTGSGSAAASTSNPEGICVDPATGKVFVADQFNYRVLRYASAESLANGAAAEIVLGQTGFGVVVGRTSSTAMTEPYDVAIDPEGNLWVADMVNHRVLRFDDAATIATGAAATKVFGQPDMVTAVAGTDADQLNRPSSLDFDSAGNLYIADEFNARVIIHLNPNAKPDGAAADIMLGQADFAAPSFATSQQILHYPGGLAVDANGTLFVSGTITNRILVWENAASLSNGALADRVIGQADFTAMAGGLSQTKFSFPKHLAIDGDGTLYVADQNNHRVLIFKNAADLSGEVPADAVLGQADFVTNAAATTVAGMDSPGGVALDNDGRLVVGDGGNSRSVFFTPRRTRPDVAIIGVEPTGAVSLTAALVYGGPYTLPTIDPFVDGAAVKRIGSIGHGVLSAMGSSVSDHPALAEVPVNASTQVLPDGPIEVGPGTTHITHVDEGAICSAMLELYQNEGIIAEPAGALATAALSQLQLPAGASVVSLVSGGNNDVSRYGEIIERSLVHRGLKHYFLVDFPQEPGALRRFLDEVLGPDDDITLFEYVKRNNRETGAALVGVELGSPDGLPELMDRMSHSRLSCERLEPGTPAYDYLT